MKLKVKKYRKWKRIDRWLQTAIIAMSIIIVGTFVTAQTISILTLGRLQIGNNVTVLSPAQLLLPDGTAAAPSLTQASNIDVGMFFETNKILFSINGTTGVAIGSGGIAMFSAVQDTFNFSADSAGIERLYLGGGLTGALDTILIRDAANTVAQKNANNDQAQRWYGANEAYFQIKTSSELLTIAAAATTDTTMDIPLNAVVRGVAVYVVTVIPTAATFTVIGATSTTVFNTAAVGVAAGSSDVGNQNTPYKNGAAQKIRITPNVSPAAATGQVRIVLMYEIPSAPTS